MRFEFATASRIVFGEGTVKKVAPLAFGMGSCALVVTGRSLERAEPLLEALHRARMRAVTFNVPFEPTIELTMEGIHHARQNSCDVVIGLGGGSVIDAAKAVAALVTNRGDIMDYLEVIGKGKPLLKTPVPCIAIPTTAGAGAEVTRNAVLTSPEQSVKVSLRSPMMLPDLAVVDPELTYSMPPDLTASTGLDALTQILESFVSVKSNPLTEAICRDGLRRAAASLQRAFSDGSDVPARENMAIASLYGGLALANSKLGAVHGFAAPMGAMFTAPHGVICARLLPFVMEANVRALRRDASDASELFLSRYDEVARILTGRSNAIAEDGIAWIKDLCAALKVPALSIFGLSEEQFPELVARSKKASSMQGNPIVLSDEDLTGILKDAVE
jgi:alcohol dehydrogenase class IV